MMMPKWLAVLNFGHVTIPGTSPWLGGCRFVVQEGVHRIMARQRLKQKPVICFNHKMLHTRDSDSNQTVPWRVVFVAVLKPTVLYTLNYLHLTGSTVIRGSCIRNVYSCNSAVTVRRDLAAFCIQTLRKAILFLQRSKVILCRTTWHILFFIQLCS
jgi:hypothetical protein